MTRHFTRRFVLGITATVPYVRPARAADSIRLGLPARAYWPPIVATAAVRQGLFAEEGIGAKPSVYRRGAEAF